MSVRFLLPDSAYTYRSIVRGEANGIERRMILLGSSQAYAFAIESLERSFCQQRHLLRSTYELSTFHHLAPLDFGEGPSRTRTREMKIIFARLGTQIIFPHLQRPRSTGEIPAIPTKPSCSTRGFHMHCTAKILVEMSLYTGPPERVFPRA